MTTQQKFKEYNQKLLSNLIPGDNEKPEGYNIIDPNSEIFTKPIKVWKAIQTDE